MAGLKASLKYFVVDAFTSSPLKGNPAVVLFLEEEKEQEYLQAIAQEFNLITCYVMKVMTTSNAAMTPRYNLRWFGPNCEAKICGHGTIASSHAIFSTEAVQGNEIEFDTLSGVFFAKRILENNNENQISGSEIVEKDKYIDIGHKKSLIELRFPLYPTVQLETDEMELVPLSVKGPSTLNIMKMSRENDLIVELMSSKDVAEFDPKMDELKKWSGRGVAIIGLAPLESKFDFYTRLFSPNYGVNEDHVCGSVHCAVAPYWSKKLGKSQLKAYMASPRGGILRLNVDVET